MDHEDDLAARLRVVNYDTSRLSEAECSEVYRLARAAKIELPRPGVAPSSLGADLTGGGLTRL